MSTSHTDAVLAGFANPWEHARLLSDRPRNDAMVRCLERLAPGRRVVEVGCGTGLLSCVAARLGAAHVIAVEPTPLVEIARELVARNGLSDRVEVVQGRIEELDRREVDLAFSELLNADPFYEGVIEASAAAAGWLAPGGVLAPRRLRVHVAVMAASESAREVRMAQSEVARLGAAHGLDTSLLHGLLRADEAYRHTSHVDVDDVLTEAVLAWDLELGAPHALEEPRTVALPVRHPGPAGAAVVWFETELCDEVTLHNRPGEQSHWGQLVCAFSEERGLRAGSTVRLELQVDDGELDIRWAEY